MLKNRIVKLAFWGLLIVTVNSFAQEGEHLIDWEIPPKQGFYKDVLNVGGPGVGAVPPHIFDWLNLSVERLSGDDCPGDRAALAQRLIGSDIDHNGMLIYPDGAPRFRLLTIGGAKSDMLDSYCDQLLPESDWVGGGERFYHFLSRTFNADGESGLSHVRNYFYHGGSYSGFCAGAFLADTDRFAFYAGYTQGIKKDMTRTGRFVGRQLDDYIYLTGLPGIFSRGGGRPTGTDIPGLEVIVRSTVENFPLIWAYQRPGMPERGRLVVSGHHPEREVRSAEVQAVVAAMYSYAIAGNGVPHIKSSLTNGQIRHMNQDTIGGREEYMKIGDLQYHHFKINVTNGNDRNLLVELDAEPGYDFNLYLHKGAPAFAGNATYQLVGPGSQKAIVLDDLTAGEWYIGVECATTVDADALVDPNYEGPVGVLNGVGYSIKATWDRNEVCNKGIDPVAVPSDVYRGQWFDVTYEGICFPLNEAAQIDLLHANNGSLARRLTNTGTLFHGENHFPWNVTDATGAYRLQVNHRDAPYYSAQSGTFNLRDIDFLANQPRVNADRLNLDWTWTGEPCRVEMTLYSNGNLLAVINPDYTQVSGLNSFSWDVNYNWNESLDYQVRFRTLDRAVNHEFESPVFTSVTGASVYLSGLAWNGLGDALIELEDCGSGYTCSREITFTNQSGNQTANFFLTVGDKPVSGTVILRKSRDLPEDSDPVSYFGMSSPCMSSFEGEGHLVLGPGQSCTVQVTFAWPSDALMPGRGLLKLESPDAALSNLGGQTEIEICATCR